MKQDFSQTRIPGVLQEISSDILERIANILQVSGIPSLIQKGRKASNRFKVSLHRH
jgi:hypothetical protein